MSATSSTRRRANGEGSISWEPARNGYVAKIRIDGRRVTLRDKDEDALLLKIQTVRVDTARGLPIPSNRLTLRRYLTEWIAGARADEERRVGTLRGYEVNVRHIASSSIGGLRLGEVKPRHVQTLLREMRALGLAERTVQYIHATLRVALEDAVELEELARNPAKVTRRKGRKRGAQQPRQRVRPLEPSQIEALRTAARPERLGALFLVAIACGLRRGELLGLRWRDIDLPRRRMHVRNQLQRVTGAGLQLVPVKTDGSERTVDLPQEVADALSAHQDRQAFEQGRALDLWRNEDLVFCTEFGGGLETTTLFRVYERVRTAAGVTARFHDLRHTTASILLAQGVSPWEVSKILGHASYQFTVDTYGHLFPESRRDAADVMNSVLVACGDH